MPADRTPVICGIGLSDYPRTPHLDSRQHHVLAMQRALRDCGLTKRDVDGYASTVDRVADMAEYLGIDYTFADSTFVGGSSFELHVQHAAAAIRDGACDTVLVTYGSNLLSSQGRKLGTKAKVAAGEPATGAMQYEAPYGSPLVAAYAMAARRHMHEFGTTAEQLAEIAVGIRELAAENPDAMYRTPLTVDDVLGSRMIADPLHLLDCCAITDGGGAFVMTTAERARDLRQPPVYVLGSSSAQTHWNIGQMPDFTTTAAGRAAARAFAQAGVTHDDVDMLMLYDSFTVTCLLLLEGLGFCGRGEGGPFVSEGHLRRGGRLPLNTDGGGLSSCHPGQRGLFLIAECVRQLRGQAGSVQVPGCRVAVAAGSGGWLSVMGVVVLGAEPAS
jgi:acetyl-CoA acetyltransferase